MSFYNMFPFLDIIFITFLLFVYIALASLRLIEIRVNVCVDVINVVCPGNNGKCINNKEKLL